jgi:DNA-binding NarL/FixJ family response regulator
MNTTLTILLVTQNPAFQDSLEQTIALLQAEWYLEHAHSLEEILARYGPSSNQADTISPEPSSMVILFDPNAQEDPGLQGIKRLMSQLPAIPIIQLLQPEEEELGLEGIKVGAQDYLLLPTLTPMKLHRTIRDAIRRHDVMQRLRQKRQTKPMQAASRPRPINVLWISKNSKDSRLLKSLFARAGEHWKFFQVATLLEAIALYHCNERLNLQPVTIDVALLDINQVIPQEMDVLTKFQQAMPDLPIIGLLENELSLYGDRIQSGFIYLVKDEISITQLLNTIQSVLQPTIAT